MIRRVTPGESSGTGKGARLATRAVELAEGFDDACREARDVLRGVPEERWSTPRTREGWTIAATAYHIARSIAAEIDLVRSIIAGGEIGVWYHRWEVLHAANAEGSQAHAARPRQDVLDTLERNRVMALEFVRGLSDA